MFALTLILMLNYISILQMLYIYHRQAEEHARTHAHTFAILLLTSLNQPADLTLVNTETKYPNNYVPSSSLAIPLPS